MIQPRLEYHTPLGQRFIGLALTASGNQAAAAALGDALTARYHRGQYEAYLDLANHAETGVTVDELQAYAARRQAEALDKSERTD